MRNHKNTSFGGVSPSQLSYVSYLTINYGTWIMCAIALVTLFFYSIRRESRRKLVEANQLLLKRREFEFKSSGFLSENVGISSFR